MSGDVRRTQGVAGVVAVNGSNSSTPIAVKMGGVRYIYINDKADQDIGQKPGLSMLIKNWGASKPRNRSAFGHCILVGFVRESLQEQPCTLQASLDISR